MNQVNKLNSLAIVLVVLFTTALSGCELAGDIFKGGMWTGIILVILVVGLLIYFLGGRGRKS